MPLPRTKDVGKIIAFLKKEKPGMSKDQRLAIALSRASKSMKNITKKIVRAPAIKTSKK